MTNTVATTSEDLGRPAAGRLAALAEAITKVYGSGDAKVIALDEVTVGIPRGGFTAVMGPSGSGKSTLMHCRAGLDTVDAGRVLVGDVDLTRLDERQLTRLRRDRVGFVFQAFNLVPTLTALENITLPIDIAGRRPDRGWLDTVIDTVGLRSRLRHRPSELSGGQQQRAAFARALAGRPEIVFADEPTGNLDSRSSAELLSFLGGSVREMGQTVVMVTHDPVAAAYADEVLFLGDGRVVGRLPDPTAEKVNQLLGMIIALLVLSVIIAALGIVNTLALSVTERTREIGLLRAVGMSRRQLRRMLRYESVMIAAFGASLGLGIGVAFGWALQRVLADDGIDVLSVPFGQLALYVVAAAILGVVAAIWPARRAARMGVLRAVTTD